MLLTVCLAGLSVAEAAPRPVEADFRKDELRAFKSLGKEADLPPVAARRELERQDPLPFFLGDTIGIADMHAHVLTEDGFDHRIVVSSPGPCDGRWHGLRYDLTRLAASLPQLLGDPTVADMLRHCPRDDVPTWRSFTHEQYGMGDLKKAHEQGLNLMVLSAMSNQFLCGLASDYSPDMDGFHMWWPEDTAHAQCTDDVNIHRQLHNVWLAEQNVNTWVKLVLSAGAANHAMAAGRLAWVLGIEGSDYLGPAPYGGIAGELLTAEREPGETADKVKDQLRHLGVTVVIATHEWNNAVGGSALQNTTLFEPGYALVRRWHREDEWGAFLLLDQLLLFQGRYNRGDYGRWPMPAVRHDVDVHYDRLAEARQFIANAEGLSGYGKELMSKLLAGPSGMVVDLTHLSERSIADLETRVGGARSARVIVSHGHPRTVARDGQDLLEYPPGDETYAWVVRKGGTIGFLPGAYSMVSSPDSPVENTCPGSSRSHAQGYHWLQYFTPFVGVGSDMNGAAIEAVPRLGPYACSVEVAPQKARQLEAVECLKEVTKLERAAEGAHTDPQFEKRDSYAWNGASDIHYVPAMLEDIDRLAAGGKDKQWMSTAGSWWSAQRFVDTWSGGGRSVADVKAPRLSEFEWPLRPADKLDAVSWAALDRCGVRWWGDEATPGMTVRPLPDKAGFYEVMVDSWSGDYPAWYLAAVEGAQDGASLGSELRNRGIPVAVDEHGHYVRQAQSKEEVNASRLHASDDCAPKDKKPVVR